MNIVYGIKDDDKVFWIKSNKDDMLSSGVFIAPPAGIYSIIESENFFYNVVNYNELYLANIMSKDDGLLSAFLGSNFRSLFFNRITFNTNELKFVLEQRITIPQNENINLIKIYSDEIEDVKYENTESLRTIERRVFFDYDFSQSNEIHVHHLIKVYKRLAVYTYVYRYKPKLQELSSFILNSTNIKQSLYSTLYLNKNSLILKNSQQENIHSLTLDIITATYNPVYLSHFLTPVKINPLHEIIQNNDINIKVSNINNIYLKGFQTA